MPSFSRRSKANLDTCHHDTIAVCHELINVTDFSVLQGHREPSEQFKLFQKGREFIEGKWIIKHKNLIVTYKDGFEKLSEHNEAPSNAVDIVPYPIVWKDINRFYYLGGAFLAVAYRLKVEGIITSEYIWGGHWNSFKDYPHYQRKK